MVPFCFYSQHCSGAWCWKGAVINNICIMSPEIEIFSFEN